MVHVMVIIINGEETMMDIKSPLHKAPLKLQHNLTQYNLLLKINLWNFRNLRMLPIG